MKANRWFKPRNTLAGWHKSQSAATRHIHLHKAMLMRARGGRPRHRAALSVMRSLLALANVSKDEETRRIARADAKWIKNTRAWRS